MNLLKKTFKYLRRGVYKICSVLAIFVGLDNVIARLGCKFEFFNKYLPERYRYKLDNYKIVTRKGINYRIFPFDKTDWEIFSNFDDFAVESALLSMKNNCNNVIFDVGANCGRFSLTLANKLQEVNPNHKIYAFEPNPIVYEKLVYNLGLNKDISGNINTIKKGLGDEQKNIELQAPLRNMGAGSLVRNYQKEPFEKFNVEIISIDNFVEENRFDYLDFMKIDVEGFEPKVLKGAEKTIDRFHPSIFIEIFHANTEDNGFSRNFIYNFFKDKGYLFYRVNDKKCAFEEIVKEEDYFRQPFFNLLCVTKPINL